MVKKIIKASLKRLKTW